MRILVPWFGLGVGSAGLVTAFIIVFGQTYDWQYPISAFLFFLFFLLLGGPLLLVSFLSSSLKLATVFDILALVFYLLGVLAALFLAASLHKGRKRWWIFSLVSPYVPAILLSSTALRPGNEYFVQKPVTRAASIPGRVEAPVDTSLKQARVRELVESIVGSDSFGHGQIQSRDEIRTHQNEPAVERYFDQALKKETDIQRRIRIVSILGDLKNQWSYRLLRDIASNDTFTDSADMYHYSSDADVDERRAEVTIFPVREAAQKALKKHR